MSIATQVITVAISRGTDRITLQREVIGVSREQQLPGGYWRADVQIVPGTVPASVWIPDSDVAIRVDGDPVAWFFGPAGNPGIVAGYIVSIPVLGPVGYLQDARYSAPTDASATTLHTSLDILRIIAADVAPGIEIGTGERTNDPQGQHALQEFDGKFLSEILDILCREGTTDGQLLDWVAFDRTIWLRRRIAPATTDAHYWIPRDHPGLSRQPDYTSRLTKLRVRYTVDGAPRVTEWASVTGATDSGRRPRSDEIDIGESSDAAAAQFRDTELARRAMPQQPTTIRAASLVTPQGVIVPPWRPRVGEYVHVEGDPVPLAIVSVRDTMPPTGVDVTLDANGNQWQKAMRGLIRAANRPSSDPRAVPGLRAEMSGEEVVATINAALARADSWELPAGTFYVTMTPDGTFTGITVPEGRQLIGRGTILLVDPASGNAFSGNQARVIKVESNATLRGVIVDGNAANISLGIDMATTLVTTVEEADSPVLEHIIARNAYSRNREGFGIRFKQCRNFIGRRLEAYDIIGSGISLDGQFDDEDLRPRDGLLSDIIVARCTWMGIVWYGALNVRASNLRLYDNSNGLETTAGARGRGWNMEWSENIALNGVDTHGNWLRGGSLIGYNDRIKVTDWTSRDDGNMTGANAQLGAPLSIVGGTWDATGEAGTTQHLTLEGCDLEAPSGKATIYYAMPVDHNMTDNRSAPRMDVIACVRPEDWTFTTGNSSINRRNIATFDYRGVRVQRSQALTLDLTSADWTKTNASATSTTSTGSRNATVYQLETTATNGRAVYATMPTGTNNGQWLDRGRVKPVVPAAVTGASSTAGTPTTIVDTGHGLTTGQQVILRDWPDATMNTLHTITVINANEFTIPITTGSSYVSPSGATYQVVPEWSIGFRKDSDSSFYDEFRLRGYEIDADEWFEFQIPSRFDGTSSDYRVAFQARTPGTQHLIVDYVTLDAVDTYGAA